MAALESAFSIAIGHAPEAMHGEMKQAMGRAMASIREETLYAAIRAFPELEPSNDEWRVVVKDRVNARVAALPPDA